MNLFELAAKITLDSSEYERGLASAGSMMKSFAGGVAKFASAVGAAGAAVVGSLISTTKKTADYGDTVDKMSQKMGLTAEAYQEWDAVMQHCGTSMETLKASMKTLANAAETGNAAFEQLGITQEEIATLNQQQLFERTIAALQNVEDTTQRTYLAGKLLGRGATELGALLNTSAEETQRMRDEVHKLGGVMSDEAVKASARFKDSLQDMTTAFTGLRNELGTKFLPSLSDAMDGLAKIFSGQDGGVELLQQGIEGFFDKLREITPKIVKVASGILSTLVDVLVKSLPDIVAAGGDMIVALVNGISRNIPRIIQAAKQIGKTLVDNLGKMLPSIVSGLGALWKELGTVTKALLAAVIAVKALSVAVTVFKSIQAAAQAMSGPIGWVTLAVGALAAGLVYLADKFRNATVYSYEFTEAQQKIIDKGQEVTRSVEAADKAFARSSLAIETETKKTQDLWAELQTLADENGNVEESNQERARYILGELNEALGTEYDMNDGIIGQYQQMQQEIDKLIQKRRAERLAQAYGEKAEESRAGITDKTKEIQVQEGVISDLERDLEAAKAKAEELAVEMKNATRGWSPDSAASATATADWAAQLEYVDSVQEALDAAQAKLEDLNAEAAQLYSDVATYEAAEVALVKGDYAEVERLVTNDTVIRWKAAAERGKISKKQMEDLKADLDYAIWYANWYQEQVKAGLQGFDPVGAEQARIQAAALQKIWRDLENDAKTHGKNFADGLAHGIRDNIDIIVGASAAAARAASETVANKLMIKSPSRLMRQFGAYIDEGLALGMTDELNAVRNAAERVADYAVPPIGTVGSGGVGSAYSDRSTSIGSIILNVDGSGVSNVERLADLVAARINNDVLRRVAAT